MAQWRTMPLDTYLSWHWKDDSSQTMAQSSVLWCSPVEANLPAVGVNCTPSAEGFELRSDGYVPLVQLLASVPGKWSDNGMALEPGQPITVQFEPESRANPAFDVLARSLMTTTQ